MSAGGELELVVMDPSFAEEYLVVVARNLERLAPWEPWAQEPPTLESIREFQTGAAARIARDEELDFAIRLDGRIMGSLGARLQGDRAEIGYWVDASVEGTGVAYRGVRELLDRLDALGFDRLRAQVGLENARSIRLLERLGFSRSPEPVEPLLLGDRVVPMIRFVRG